MPIIARANARELASTASLPSPPEENHEPMTAARRRYLEVTAFVLRSVRPMYQGEDVPFSDVALAAVVATIFISETRSV